MEDATVIGLEVEDDVKITLTNPHPRIAIWGQF